MRIIDNFLPTDVCENILKEMDGLDFPWFYRNYSANQGDKVPQFVHVFYAFDNINSSLFKLITPMLLEFELQAGYKIKSIHKIKANLILNAPINKNNLKNAVHIDNSAKNHVTCLYYVDDSDGDTVIYADDKKTEVKRIQPKANRAVIFDSNTWHNATPPIKHPTRRVINLVFEVI